MEKERNENLAPVMTYRWLAELGVVRSLYRREFAHWVQIDEPSEREEQVALTLEPYEKGLRTSYIACDEYGCYFRVILK